MWSSLRAPPERTEAENKVGKVGQVPCFVESGSVFEIDQVKKVGQLQTRCHVGCGRVFEPHQNKLTEVENKVGKVGQVPSFVVFLRV